MIRTALFAMLVFSASSLLLAAPGDVLLTKPTVACPQTQLGDEALQAQYDGLWKAYSDGVAVATKAAEDELTRLYEGAKSAGNLDLALFWNGLKKSLAETGQLRWEPISQKKEWKRFGDAEFPEELTAILSKSDAGFDKAKDALEEGYKTLEVALTKADKLEQALAIRKEFKALWGGATSQTVEQAKTETGKASVNLLDGLDIESGRQHDCWKMVGKCLHCTGNGIQSFSTFTIQRPQIERLAVKGEYDLAFSVLMKPPKDKFGSDVVIRLPGVPSSPTLWLRHYWKSKQPSLVMLQGGKETFVDGHPQPNINVPSPVPLDGSRKIAIKVKVRKKGAAVTVLVNGRPAVDCSQFQALPISEALGFSVSLETELTICDLTISEPEK